MVGIRIGLLALLAFAATACGILLPQPSETASPYASPVQPTSVQEPPPQTEVPPPLQPTSPPETPTGEPSAPAADVILHNGAIVTMEADQPQAQALAIQGENILATGSDEEILPLAGPETQIVDLAGRTVLPGFIDGHTHVLRFPDRAGKTLDEAIEVALSYGLTTVNEMAADGPFLERLMEAEREGRLRLRVNVFPEYNAGIVDDEGNTIYMRVWFPEQGPILESDRRLRIPGIKIFADGGFTPGRGCWALTDPYPEALRAEPWFREFGCRERGTLYLSQDELNQAVADAQAAGFRVSFHAGGDHGIDAVLNAIEYALDGESNERHRHQIQHSSLLRPDQMQRYVDLNVLASVRGYFNTCEQAEYQYYFGASRFEWIADRFALPGLGIHAYAEGDFGWTTDPGDRASARPIDPLLTLYGLVTHQQLREDGTACEPDPWIARHEISVEKGLRMLTVEPAFAVSQEDVIGGLTPGRFADLVILSDNPLTVDPNAMVDIKVLMTMVGGRVEYCAGGHEALCPILGTPIPPTPTQTAVPPTATPTAESGAPVEISLAAQEKWVAANTPIVLRFGWVTDTPEQVADFLGSLELVVSLDGELARDTGNYWSEIEEYGDHDVDGDMDYHTQWLYPVGVLSPGTHRVESQMRLQWPVTDGFDSDADGVPDEYSGTWEFSLQIVVGQ